MSGARRIKAVYAAVVLAAILVPVTAGSSLACSETAAGDPRLVDFTSQPTLAYADAPVFYYGTENQGSIQATVGMVNGDCQGLQSEASYDTDGATAEEGVDFTAASGDADRLCHDFHPDYCAGSGLPQEDPIAVPVTDDGATESALETFIFKLTGSSTGGLAQPSQAPVHLIDDDGTERFSIEPTLDGAEAVTYARLEGQPRFLVPVFRAGDASSPATLPVTVSGTGTNPATPAEDYTLPATTVGFAAGERFKYLQINIRNDKLYETDETLSVTLEPPAGTSLGGPGSTTLTIVETDFDTIYPVTRFHHPKHQKKYSRGDYRLREMHVFFSDEGGSTVTRVQMALRKKMRSGACRWWTGSGFVGRPCDSKRWVEMTLNFDLYFERFPALHPTGGKVRHYTAWSRATDGAANVESIFTTGRNANKFWVAG